MKYKMLALDIDGTIISSSYVLKKEVKESITRVTNKGVKVTIATGRFYNSAINIAKAAGINMPMISNDGAQIQDIYSEELVYFNPLPINTASDICKLLLVYPLEFQLFFKNYKVYSGNNFAFKQTSNFFKRKKRFTFNGFYNYVRDFASGKVVNAGNGANAIKYLKEPPAKLVVYGEKEIMKSLLKELNGSFNDKVSTTSAVQNYMDILNKGISKAKGLEIISRKYGIKREEIIAVGDNFNDLEMIKYAGLGIAMGNAPDKVKDEADYVTDTNDNGGIVKLINKFLLNQ